MSLTKEQIEKADKIMQEANKKDFSKNLPDKWGFNLKTYFKINDAWHDRLTKMAKDRGN